MHPTPVFHWADREEMLAFVGERAFATIACSLDGVVAFAQAPVLVDGARLLLHLSRANRIAKRLPVRASLIVTGPDTYVSPDWYGEPDQVPTWSYVSVELDGELAGTDEAQTLEILRKQSAVFEGRLTGKPAWTPDRMTPSVLAAKVKGIVGVTLAIDAVRGTRKLSQNKSESDRARVSQVLADSPREADRTIAQLMRS